MLHKKNNILQYKVFVGIHFGYNQLKVGYAENDGQKKIKKYKFTDINTKYPSIILDSQKILHVGNNSINKFFEKNKNNKNNKDNNYYIFDNFIMTLCNNKLIEIENNENYYNDDDDDNKQNDQIYIKDKNGKSTLFGTIAKFIDFFYNLL